MFVVYQKGFTYIHIPNCPLLSTSTEVRVLLEEIQQVVVSTRDLPTHLFGGNNKVLHLLASTLQSSLKEIPEPVAVQVSSTATLLPTTGLLNCNTSIV